MTVLANTKKYFVYSNKKTIKKVIDEIIHNYIHTISTKYDLDPIEEKGFYPNLIIKEVILEDISAQFKPGMCNLIIGASGSGKTVLTKCIVDLIQADKGNIFFDSVDSATMSKEDRKELRNNIGMLFQGNALFDSLTVEENVRFPLDMFTTLSDIEKIEKVNKILARVNLTGFNLIIRYYLD